MSETKQTEDLAPSTNDGAAVQTMGTHFVGVTFLGTSFVEPTPATRLEAIAEKGTEGT